MIKQTPAKYAQGDKVTTTLSKGDVLTIKGEPSWNGFTWMYTFEEIDMRCGEGYIKLQPVEVGK